MCSTYIHIHRSLYKTITENQLTLEELVHKKCLQVAFQETQSIRVGEDVIPVETDLGFSKFGKVYSIATIQLKNQTYSETGETVNEAVNNLAIKMSQGDGKMG